MANIVWHARTKQQVDAFIAAPSHAVMLNGQAGSGKSTIIDYILSKLIDLKSPYITRIVPENDSISIAVIRDIEKLLTLKVPNNDVVNRIVVIERADLMTHEAQNAILKNIEEPPQGTLFILTCDDITTVLQTIQSRVVTIDVHIPDTEQLTHFFVQAGHSKAVVDKALLQSGGLPGLTYALLENTDHPLIKAAENAKILLGGQRFQKLTIVDSLSKSRSETADTLQVMQRIAHLQLPKATHQSAKQWARVSEVSYKAQVMLHDNAQPKLVLDYLCLNI